MKILSSIMPLPLLFPRSFHYRDFNVNIKLKFFASDKSSSKADNEDAKSSEEYWILYIQIALYCPRIGAAIIVLSF